MTCINEITDIETLVKSNVSIENINNKISNHITPSDDIMKLFVSDFMNEIITSKNVNKITLDNICKKLKQKYRIAPSKSDIRNSYDKYFSKIIISTLFKKWMIKKVMRSESGVLVATIVLSPHKFSCKYDCFYCPQETDLKGVHTQPRSYLSTEPAMQRAINTRPDLNSYDFSVRNQFQNRNEAYNNTGNTVENNKNSNKMEIILSGGTWESYPKDYREQVILDIFYSANTMYQTNPRPVKSLQEEQHENETTKFRIIGLTIETRPDNITPENIQDYCRWGVTRVQIGVQHFDDTILKNINRKCYNKDTIRAIRLLKQAAFKVVVHLMPDLPGSTPELDKWMFEQAIYNPDLQFDDVKIYPTAVCKSPDSDRIVYSKIGEWYEQGTYKPYAEKNITDLFDVLIYYKTNISPWVRIQRLIRDIPAKSIEAGYNKKSNLRQMLIDGMKKKGLKCNCIFCMEIGDKELDDLTPIIVVRKYNASEGIEYHLSIEAHDMNKYQRFAYIMNIMYNYIVWFFTGKWNYWSGNLQSYIALFGFLRLRFDPNPGGNFILEINNCALIREVHVYGSSISIGNDAIGSQHRGFGKMLVKTAEEISSMNGYYKTAVIAGVGTREYYKNKCGYTLGNTYMLKDLPSYNYNVVYWIYIASIIIGLISIVISIILF